MIKIFAIQNAKGHVVGLCDSEHLRVDPTENGWMAVDEGEGDQYANARENYLDGPLLDAEGRCRYKIAGGSIVPRTEEEIAADEVPGIEIPCTEKLKIRLTATEEALSAIMDLMLGGN